MRFAAVMKCGLHVALFFLATVVGATAAGATSQPLPALDVVNEQYRQYQVTGYQLTDGSTKVFVIRRDGTVVFESRYPVIAADGKHLSWWYRDGEEFSLSTPIDDTQVVTLRGMIFAAKDIVRMIKGGTTPETNHSETAGRESLSPTRRRSLRMRLSL